jgi:hypothetical protein
MEPPQPKQAPWLTRTWSKDLNRAPWISGHDSGWDWGGAERSSSRGLAERDCRFIRILLRSDPHLLNGQNAKLVWWLVLLPEPDYCRC